MLSELCFEVDHKFVEAVHRTAVKNPIQHAVYKSVLEHSIMDVVATSTIKAATFIHSVVMFVKPKTRRYLYIQAQTGKICKKV